MRKDLLQFYLDAPLPIPDDVVEALLAPDKFEWPETPTRVEKALLDALDNGSTILRDWTLWDRSQMHKIVNEARRETIRFQPTPGGLKIEVLK